MTQWDVKAMGCQSQYRGSQSGNFGGRPMRQNWRQDSTSGGRILGGRTMERKMSWTPTPSHLIKQMSRKRGPRRKGGKNTKWNAENFLSGLRKVNVILGNFPGASFWEVHDLAPHIRRDPQVTISRHDDFNTKSWSNQWMISDYEKHGFLAANKALLLIVGASNPSKCPEKLHGCAHLSRNFQQLQLGSQGEGNNIFSSRITIFCPNADQKLGSTLGSRMTMRESLPFFLVACELPRLKNKNQATINIQNMELTFELLLNLQQNPETAGLSCFSLYGVHCWTSQKRINDRTLSEFSPLSCVCKSYRHMKLSTMSLTGPDWSCDAFMRTTRVRLVCWIESSDNKERLWLIVSAICAPELQDVISSL